MIDRILLTLHTWLPDAGALWEHMWKSALLVGALIALRYAIKPLRPHARLLDLLWLAVALRLLIPGTLSSPIGFFQPAFDSLLRASSIDVSASGTVLSVQGGSSFLAGAGGSGQVPLSPVGLVWLSGMVLAFAFCLVAACRFRLSLRPADSPGLLAACRLAAAELGIAKPPALTFSRRVESPALFGFIRPRIVLPERAVTDFNEVELRHIFLHELAHYRRKDHWLHALQLAALAVNWFNPLAWFAFRLAARDREESCDELAARAADSPRDYGQTLLSLYSTLSRRRPLPEPAISMTSQTKQSMKKRIELLSADPPPPLRRRGLSVAGFFALAFMVAWLGAERPPSYAQENSESKPVETGPKEDAPASLQERLESAIVADLDLQNMPVKEAVDFMLKQVQGNPIPVLAYPNETTITLRLSQIPVKTGLEYLAQLSKTKLRIEGNGIGFAVPEEDSDKDGKVVIVRAVLREVKDDKASTLTMPAMMVFSGQRAKSMIGVEKTWTKGYDFSSGTPEPDIGRAHIGTVFEIEPVVDKEMKNAAVALVFQHTWDFKVETETVLQDPGSGKELEFQKAEFRTAELITKVNVPLGGTRVLKFQDGADDDTRDFELTVSAELAE